MTMSSGSILPSSLDNASSSLLSGSSGSTGSTGDTYTDLLNQMVSGTSSSELGGYSKGLSSLISDNQTSLSDSIGDTTSLQSLVEDASNSGSSIDWSSISSILKKLTDDTAASDSSVPGSSINSAISSLTSQTPTWGGTGKSQYSFQQMTPTSIKKALSVLKSRMGSGTV
jgi:hypothetical protein